MKDLRVKGLIKAAERMRIAEQKHDGHGQCYQTGVINRLKHLLVEEDGMSPAEVDEIEKRAKEKAGI